jgi:hypothetical protein
MPLEKKACATVLYKEHRLAVSNYSELERGSKEPSQLVRPEPSWLRKTRTQPFHYQTIHTRAPNLLSAIAPKKVPFHKVEKTRSITKREASRHIHTRSRSVQSRKECCSISCGREIGLLNLSAPSPLQKDVLEARRGSVRIETDSTCGLFS